MPCPYVTAGVASGRLSKMPSLTTLNLVSGVGFVVYGVGRLPC